MQNLFQRSNASRLKSGVVLHVRSRFTEEVFHSGKAAVVIAGDSCQEGGVFHRGLVFIDPGESIRRFVGRLVAEDHEFIKTGSRKFPETGNGVGGFLNRMFVFPPISSERSVFPLIRGNMTRMIDADNRNTDRIAAVALELSRLMIKQIDRVINDLVQVTANVTTRQPNVASVVLIQVHHLLARTAAASLALHVVRLHLLEVHDGFLILN
jgi:hypothetical protein